MKKIQINIHTDIQNMSKQWQSLLKGLLTTLMIIILFLFGKYLISLNSFDPVQNIIENYNLSDFYFRWHSHSNTKGAAKYMIIDISDGDKHSRSEIAALLEKIDQAHPKVIGLDVFFPTASNMQQNENDSLLHVLQRLQSPLVAASLLEPINEDSCLYESSFFIPLLQGKQNIIEGLADFPNNRIVRAYQPIWIVGKKSYPTFAKQIADIVGVPMASNDKEHLINYANTDTIVMRSQELKNADILSDRVVLIGDMRDKRDQFLIPVSLNAARRCPGVEIHKQILLTAESGWDPYTMPKWIVLIISFFVIWGFCWIACHFKGRRFVRYVNWGFICAAVIVGDCLFWAGIHFSMLYILIGLALASSAASLLEVLRDFYNKFSHLC
ncbi:MAG: CHASE2 domain-containing protein [Paludibacteraceae bacterium]|nr:CHASE2 domain-containing protein [Paludibacteraceae bacterium]